MVHLEVCNNTSEELRDPEVDYFNVVATKVSNYPRDPWTWYSFSMLTIIKQRSYIRQPDIS